MAKVLPRSMERAVSPMVEERMVLKEVGKKMGSKEKLQKHKCNKMARLQEAARRLLRRLPEEKLRKDQGPKPRRTGWVLKESCSKKQHKSSRPSVDRA